MSALLELAQKIEMRLKLHADLGTDIRFTLSRDAAQAFAEQLRVTDELVAEVGRLRAERLKLDKRIHNQRKALRETWEIVEMRRKWMGSETARRLYANLLKRYRALRDQMASGETC